MTDSNEPTMEIDDYGNKYWYLNGKYHREDGPALSGLMAISLGG